MLTLKSLICRVLRYFNCFGFCSFYFNLVWLSTFCMVGLWDQGSGWDQAFPSGKPCFCKKKLTSKSQAGAGVLHLIFDSLIFAKFSILQFLKH